MMREIGRGHTPTNENIKAYNDMPEKTASAYKQAANQSIQNAANESRFKQQDDKNVEMIDTNFKNAIADIIISCDRSWQKRGFLSLNGLVTLIAGVSSKRCKVASTNKTMQFLFFMGTEKRHRT